MTARSRTLILSWAFLLTGVGVAVLGASLPAMLHQWQLTDRRAGLLLFADFAGSAMGVLIAGRSPRLMSGFGLVGSALAAILLSIASPAPLLLLFLLYGTGLGTAMTSLSLLRSREVPANETALEMSRLNLLWALGACCAPSLALHSLRAVSVASLFRGLAAAYLVTGFVVFLARNSAPRPPVQTPVPLPVVQRLAPFRMCAFSFAAVGLETAIGGWLTAYTQRSAHSTGIAVTANSFFWLGLLLSRGAHSLRSLRVLQSPAGILVHLGSITVAVGLMVGAPTEVPLAFSAFLAGFGLGPLYPLVLSWALPYFRSSGVFMLAGVGASVLPWLTGVVSTAAGTLRYGLLVPCAAVIGLLSAALSMRRQIQGSNMVPDAISTRDRLPFATEHKL
jgi:FHS family glucose/mannose:H+ symporter-like MFS transporter